VAGTEKKGLDSDSKSKQLGVENFTIVKFRRAVVFQRVRRPLDQKRSL